MPHVERCACLPRVVAAKSMSQKCFVLRGRSGMMTVFNVQLWMNFLFGMFGEDRENFHG